MWGLPHPAQQARGGVRHGSGLSLWTKSQQPGGTVSERLIASIDQPCILCEGTLETWNIYKDEEAKGIERIDRKVVAHTCDFLVALKIERHRSRNRLKR